MSRHLPIITVLGAAAVLRIWGISFGLPHTLTRPDEEAVISIALGFFRRTLNPGFFDWPSLFMYAVTVGFVVYFNIGRRAGMFPYEISFISAASANPTPLHLIARSLSTMAGVVTVWTVHRIGLRLFDTATALTAALFLATAALHVRDSHFGMTDVAASCLLMQSFLFTVRARDGTRRDLFLSAVWAGLAASTKYNAGLVALPAVWLIATGELPWTTHWVARLRWLLAYAGIALLAFLVGTPYAVLDPQPFLAGLVRIGEHLREGHAAFAGYGWVIHFSTSLRYGIGIPMLIAGLVGMTRYCWLDPRRGALLVMFPVAYFLLIGSGQTAFARYIIPVVPFLCLAGAYAVVDLARWLAAWIGRPSWGQAFIWVLAALVAAPSTWSAVRTNILMTREDNRLVAASWIRDRFPTAQLHQAGAIYAAVQMQTADPNAVDHYREVAFDESSEIFRNAGGELVEPDLVVVPECPLAYCGASAPLRNVIARDYQLERTFNALDPAHDGLAYDLDDAFFVPLAGFSGVERPGPNLFVYVRRASR